MTYAFPHPPRSTTSAHPARPGAITSRTPRGTTTPPLEQVIREMTVRPAALVPLLAADEHDTEAITRALEQAPPLAARILGLANATAWGPLHRLISTRRAVLHLGPARSRTAALAASLQMLSRHGRVSNPLMDTFWISAIRKASAARLAAEALAPSKASWAHTVGLLQDLALPVLVTLAPDFYQRLRKDRRADHASTWCQRERERFGIDHAELGRQLLAAWGVDKDLCDAVARHHQVPADPTHHPRDRQRLASFLAALLPHLDEAPTPTDRQWISVLHTRFLLEKYPSPQAFLQAVLAHAQPLQATLNAPQPSRQQLEQALIEAVATDTLSLTTALCRVEARLSRQNESLMLLKEAAFTDALTRLLNRRGFLELARRRLQDATDDTHGVCLMLLDLDGLKPVNDQLGHAAGDRLIRALAKTIRRHMARTDLIARLGGDEFVVLLTGITHDDAMAVAQRLSEACRKRSVPVHPDHTVPLAASIGAVYSPTVPATLRPDDLLQAADQAMYHQKQAGKGGYEFRLLPIDAPFDGIPTIRTDKSPKTRPPMSARWPATAT